MAGMILDVGVERHEVVTVFPQSADWGKTVYASMRSVPVIHV